MPTIPPEASRNSVRMPDGSYRVVPSAQEVVNYLRLEVREFPDGVSRLSVSVRGLWEISLNGIFFPAWWKSKQALAEGRRFVWFAEPAPGVDFFLDAFDAYVIIGASNTKRNRAAAAIINRRINDEEVRSRVRSEMVVIMALTNPAHLRRRAQELLGDADVLSWPASAVGEGSGVGNPVDGRAAHEGEPGDSEVGDVTRFVPVVERDVGGRRVLSVVARDVYVFVGSSRGFSHWFADQAGGSRLVEGVDYVPAILGGTAQNASSGRPAKDYVLTLDAAKEVCMMDDGPRGKELRLYFLECERLKDAGGMVASPAPGPLPSSMPLGVRDPRSIDVAEIHLGVADFLSLQGVPQHVARDVAPSAERLIVASILGGGMAGRFGLHPVPYSTAIGSKPRVVFDHVALMAWWRGAQAEVMSVLLGGRPPEG